MHKQLSTLDWNSLSRVLRLETPELKVAESLRRQRLHAQVAGASRRTYGSAPGMFKLLECHDANNPISPTLLCTNFHDVGGFLDTVSAA